MKKYICFVTLICTCLVSCNSTQEPAPVTKAPVIVTTSESTIETTVAEIPPAVTETSTEPEISEHLFEEQGVEIFYQGIDKNIVNLLVANPFEHDPVNVYMQNVSVNGFSLDNYGCECRAEENTSTVIPFVIPLEELQSRDITRINELKFTLKLYSGEWAVDTEEFTVVR